MEEHVCPRNVKDIFHFLEIVFFCPINNWVLIEFCFDAKRCILLGWVVKIWMFNVYSKDGIAGIEQLPFVHLYTELSGTVHPRQHLKIDLLEDGKLNYINFKWYTVWDNIGESLRDTLFLRASGLSLPHQIWAAPTWMLVQIRTGASIGALVLKLRKDFGPRKVVEVRGKDWEALVPLRAQPPIWLLTAFWDNQWSYTPIVAIHNFDLSND